MERKKNPSAFIRNTCAMLERSELASIVAWSDDGHGFIILDLPLFEAQVLPQYFRHQKYTSFVRQLNMYGFHKQRHPLSENYFQHETFVRGQHLSEIKRKPEKKKKVGEDSPSRPQQSQAHIEPVFQNCPHAPRSQQEEMSIKSEKMREEEEQDQASEECDQGSLSFLSQQAILQNQILRKTQPLIMEYCLQMRKERVRVLKISLEKPQWDNPESISFACGLLGPLATLLKQEMMKLEGGQQEVKQYSQS